MQTIKKFKPERLYSTLSNNNWYELINRDGMHLTFRVRKAGTKDTWTQEADSTFKADGNGAFESVRFTDGTVINANHYSSRLMSLDEVEPELREAVIKTLDDIK